MHPIRVWTPLKTRGGAMDDRQLSELSVVIPNLHWRYSGVTATNRVVAPRLDGSAGWFGSDAPAGVAQLSLGDLVRLRRTSQCRKLRVWHARRNNEMLAGLLLKSLGWPFKLVFTSAAQRRHSWITRSLLARMDAVIATSEVSAAFLQRPATVVLHGVDPQIYSPAADRAAAFAAAGLPGKYAIGCFGRVREQKGTDVFVEAMCRLLPRYPDFCAVVVGAITADQTAFAEDLKSKVETAGLSSRVVMTGELPIEELPRW